MSEKVTKHDVEMAGCVYMDNLSKTGYGGVDANSPLRLVQIALGDRAPRDTLSALNGELRPEALGVLRRASDTHYAVSLRHRRKDYGKQAGAMRSNLPMKSAPALTALLNLLEVDGHDMTACGAELRFLLQLVFSAYGW